MLHIKRHMAFGDVLWIEPVVRHFLNLSHKVNVVTSYPEVFENSPHLGLTVNNSLRYNVDYALDRVRGLMNFKKHVINLDLAYELHPKMHILEAYFKAAKINPIELSYPRIYLTNLEKQAIIPGDYVVLHIEENLRNSRNVYSVDWNKVIAYFKSLGIDVVQISKNRNNIYGRWIETKNFREVMSLIYNSKYFIGLDSGPSHIAAAFGIPSIIFFGSINPAFRHLKSFKGIFLQSSCEYAHCYHEVVGCGPPCRIVGDKGIPKCCTHTTEEIIEAIDQLRLQ